MTTKVIYTNGNNITIEGTLDAHLEVRVPGFLGSVTDKGKEGASITFHCPEGADARSPITLDSSRTVASGKELASHWIKEVLWAPPEIRG